MSDTPPVIRFTATIAQVRTMADGGLRFVFDVPETAIEAATALMQAKQGGAVLEVAAVAIVVEPTIQEAKTENVRRPRNPLYAKKADA